VRFHVSTAREAERPREVGEGTKDEQLS
jgi:hypothetical protein